MVSVRYLCTSLERFGLINFHRFARHDWKNSLQSVYVFCQSTLFLFHILCHLFSTLTRATRYLPEFFQTFLEDCVIFFLAYAVYFLRSRHHQITYLSDFMETAFSKADPRIIQKCYRQGKLTCLGFLIVVALAIAGSFLETFLPMSSSELRIRRSVYSETKHPERRLPFNLRVPFVDETESWAYEIIYAIDIYIMINFIFWVSLSVSVVPIMILHIRGQYEILSKYVALIGKEHRDGHGYRIFYNNIEADDYMVKMYSGVGRRRRGRFRDVCLALRRQITYERHYLRQIIEFHQKLLNFQDELVKPFSPVVFGLIVANNIMISLCLYQIVVSPNKLSPLRYFKFITEFIAITMEYFIICNCSEIMDDCNGLMRSALMNCGWDKCSTSLRRDLCFLWRRVQRSNHLRFYNGAVILSRLFFLQVVKVAYTFTNFMRLKSSHG